METMMKIGNTIAPETVEQVGVEIRAIFQEAAKSHIDQDTIKVALKVLQTACSIEDITVQHCNFGLPPKKGGN